MKRKKHAHGGPGFKGCTHPLCRARRSAAQADLRERRIMELRYWDPDQQTHITRGAPHGTEGGATNWRCQCRWVPGTEHSEHPIPGCQPVSAAAASARWRRSTEDAQTHRPTHPTPRGRTR